MPKLNAIKTEVLCTENEGQALKLVKSYMGERMAGLKLVELTNCSLMAEFALMHWCKWTKNQVKNSLTAPNPVELLATHATLPLVADSMYVELPGHNIAIFQDGQSKLWAGVNAWDGEFHLFPNFNDHSKDYSIWNVSERELIHWIFKTFKEHDPSTVAKVQLRKVLDKDKEVLPQNLKKRSCVIL